MAASSALINGSVLSCAHSAWMYDLSETLPILHRSNNEIIIRGNVWACHQGMFQQTNRVFKKGEARWGMQLLLRLWWLHNYITDWDGYAQMNSQQICRIVKEKNESHNLKSWLKLGARKAGMQLHSFLLKYTDHTTVPMRGWLCTQSII